MKTFKLGAIAALLAIASLLSGCATATVTEKQNVGPVPGEKPTVIYVKNFDLDYVNVKSESLLPGRGPLRRLLIGMPNDPQKFRDKTVDTMADAIIKELQEAGYDAQHLPPNAFLPTNGWLLRGVFVNVDEGNRIRRTVVGFGLGETELKVAVDVSDLNQGLPKPFYKVDTQSHSSRIPGAGPLVVISPVAIPVRFVLSGQDMNKCMEKTAVLIGSEVSARIKETERPAK